jgi:hypothetical protein|nr:MAG TPA: asparaginyl-tRNA synthetase [Caudoviricetes sp.]
MDKNIFLKNSSGETLNPATSSLKVTAFSASSLNNYTNLVVYLPHGLIEFNVYGKSQQDNVYSITIGLPDDTRKKLYAMFGEILRTGTGVAKNNGNSETYMFTYNLAIGSTSGTLLIKLNKPITILTTSTITFTTNLNKFVTPSALGVLDGTDTNDTQPVHIDGAGKLWTAPGGGTEITIDPNGGLQNTPNGLSIKGDSTAQGGPGIVTGSTGTYTPISSDGKRGSIIGVSKTDQQTEVVGIGPDGKLYTKPIGGTGDIEIDPAGGLEKGSAGYGLMLDAKSGLNVDEDGLKIKPDTAGRGSGLYVSTAGIRVSQSTNNTLGGIVGTASTSTQTEAVGIDDQGRLYTKEICDNVLFVGINALYVDAVNGNDTNNGSSSAPFQTLQHAFNSFPDFLETAQVYIIGDYGSGANFWTFKKHAKELQIIGDSLDKTNILKDGIIVYNTSNVIFSYLKLQSQIVVELKQPNWRVHFNVCDINQQYTAETKSENCCVVKDSTVRSSIGSITAVGNNLNWHCFALYHGLANLIIIPKLGDSDCTGGIEKYINISGYNNGSIKDGDFIVNSSQITFPTAKYLYSLKNIFDMSHPQPIRTQTWAISPASPKISNAIGFNVKAVMTGTEGSALNVAGYLTLGQDLNKANVNALGTATAFKGNFNGIGYASFDGVISVAYIEITTSGTVNMQLLTNNTGTVTAGTSFTIQANSNLGGLA